MTGQTLDTKRKTLDIFAERVCDVRLSLKGGIEGKKGYVVLAPVRNGKGEHIDTYEHYHISEDLGAVPLRLRHITPFSLNGGTRGLIRVDSNYGGVF